MADVKRLKFPDDVRTRPGMYIGGLDTPQVAVREVIDNSVDEVHGGRALNVWIYNRINDSGRMEYIVADDGSGLPIKEAFDEEILDDGTIHKSMLGITQAQLAMGSLHAGTKFNKTEVGTGQNGVGSSVTNALSDTFDVYTRFQGQNVYEAPDSVHQLIKNNFGELTKFAKFYYYHLHFERGILKAEDVIDIRSTDLPDKIKEVYPSTITSFLPDITKFKTDKCKIPLTTRYVKYLHPEAHFFVNDVEDESIPTTFEYPFNVHCNNLNMSDDEDCLNPYIDFVGTIGISEKFEETEWDMSVNGLDTQTGLHVKAIQSAYSKAFEEFFGDVKGRAYMGINMMCITLCNEPMFSSQTKERLADIPDFYVYDVPMLVSAFRKIIKNNYDAFKTNWLRILEYLKSIQNADRISLIKSKVLITAESGVRSQCFVPHKLKDCSCVDRNRAELFIVEGNSAAGTLIQARHGMDNIAVLPLRGKPLNTVYHDVNDILENAEMYDLINAIGVGVNEAYDLSEVRYGKIIICADADSDGCITGDTEVHTLKYGPVKISELNEKFGDEDIWVWARNKDGEQVPAKACNVHITKQVTKLLRVHLDNGKYVDFTDNHLIMMRDGTYKRADELQVNDSVMPFYFEYDYKWHSGYINADKCIYDDSEGWYKPEYWMVYDAIYGADSRVGLQVHHIDGNHKNNTPSNLAAISMEEHGSITMSEYNSSEKHINRVKELHRSGHYARTGSYDGLINWNSSQVHRDQVSEMNNDEEVKYNQLLGKYLKVIARLNYLNKPITEENFEKYKPFTSYNSWDETLVNEAIRYGKDNEYLYERHLEACQGLSESDLMVKPHVQAMSSATISGINHVNRILADNGVVNRDLYDSTRPKHGCCSYDSLMYNLDIDESNLVTYCRNYNHKVTSIEIITHDNPIDVWDLSVPEYNNFALENGMYVHNSQINALVLGALLYHLTFLVDAGYVYVAESPLYLQDGKYYYPGEEDKIDFNRKVTRFKGLGELKPNQFKDTVLNSETRKLKQITKGDLEKSYALLTSTTARCRLMESNGLVDVNDVISSDTVKFPGVV